MNLLEDAKSLLLEAFDPEDIQPLPLDFSDFQTEARRKQKQRERETKANKDKKDDKDDQGVDTDKAGPAGDQAGGPQETKLPKRLILDAFSTTVGWRPTGCQFGQVKTFVQRFPKDFSLLAMGKIVLPCYEGLPYVTKDGKLPCPLLATMNAIKVIQKKNAFEGDGQATKDLMHVLIQGVQV